MHESLQVTIFFFFTFSHHIYVLQVSNIKHFPSLKRYATCTHESNLHLFTS